MKRVSEMLHEKPDVSSLFASAEARTLFIGEIERLIRESNGEPIAVIHGGRVLGYLITPPKTLSL